MCLRACLAYLPHAQVKTSKGAWLANAIRDEYGPPPAFGVPRGCNSPEGSKYHDPICNAPWEPHRLTAKAENRRSCACAMPS